jgi:hypothetical protein
MVLPLILALGAGFVGLSGGRALVGSAAALYVTGSVIEASTLEREQRLGLNSKRDGSARKWKILNLKKLQKGLPDSFKHLADEGDMPLLLREYGEFIDAVESAVEGRESNYDLEWLVKVTRARKADWRVRSELNLR